MEIPVINKEYNYFDDGKITESRLDSVLITTVIPAKDVEIDIFKLWNDDVERCDWLYNEVTDYFVKGHLIETNVDVVFVRTKDNGWFSLGWDAGRLDIDGKLTEKLNQFNQ